MQADGAALCPISRNSSCSDGYRYQIMRAPETVPYIYTTAAAGVRPAGAAGWPGQHGVGGLGQDAHLGEFHHFHWPCPHRGYAIRLQSGFR